MASRQIQHEVRSLLLPGLRLCVVVESSRRDAGWRTAVLQESENPTPFVVPRAAIAPHEYFQSEDRSCLLWPKRISFWRESLLLQCFDSLALSVDLAGCFLLTVTVTFRGQKTVDVHLDTHPKWHMNPGSDSVNYIEIKQLTTRAVAKLKAKTIRRVSGFSHVNRELIEDIESDLSKVGWHSYPQKREPTDDALPAREFVWHISAPGTSIQDEKKLRSAEEAMMC